MEIDSKKLFKTIITSYNNYELNKLSDEEKNELIELSNNIDKYYLYKYDFHGINHSQKVLLYSYLIAKELGLNENDKKILFDAAIYHDVGRENENEDTTHGLSSVNLYSKLFKNDIFYKDPINFKLLSAITDGHCQKENNTENNYYYYFDDESECFERYKLLLSILKDADGLDRTRFPKFSSAFIDSNFLRNVYSKSLIDFAYEINQIYVEEIDKLNYDNNYLLFKYTEKNNSCFHAIGWDFTKLDGILKNGILSNYAAQQNNINLSRNFFGNNSNMWVSVIDANNVDLEGAAFKTFADDSIVFYCIAGKFKEGIDNRSEAFASGEPIKSFLYDDEVFVFDSIPKEDICAIIMPKNIMDKNVTELEFLNCCNDYNVVENRVNSYCDYLIDELNVNVDKTIFNNDLNSLENYQKEFKEISNGDRNQLLKIYEEKTNIIVNNINKTLCGVIENSYRDYFGLENDQEVKTGMIIKNILEKNNISYQETDSCETVINLSWNQKSK